MRTADACPPEDQLVSFAALVRETATPAGPLDDHDQVYRAR